MVRLLHMLPPQLKQAARPPSQSAAGASLPVVLLSCHGQAHLTQFRLLHGIEVNGAPGMSSVFVQSRGREIFFLD